MSDQHRRPWTRRAVLWSGALGLGAVSGWLAACGGAPPASPTAAPKPAQPAAQPTSAPAAAQPAASTKLTKDQITLIFMHHVAGGENEQRAYDQTLDTWAKLHPNIKIEPQVVPDRDRITKAQAMVAADQASDMWRHNGGVIRLWAFQGHLLDLTDLLPKGYDQKFLPALMNYCLFKGRVFGLPHTTDTSALFFREDALEAIGVKPPTDLKDAWTFEQFGDICNKLLGVKKQQYAFTHNQGGGRWVPSFLYSTGAKVVTDDFSKVAINSPEGIAALAFLKDWTDKKWAPPSIWTSRVPNEDTDQFARGTASMAILGQWNITYLDDNIKNNFKWHVTFIPKAKVQTTSLGGTPVVGWKKTKYPQEVAAFFEFFTSVEMIKLFDEMANYVPVRSDMTEMKLNFQVRNDLMQVFHQQIKTLPPHFVSYVARSYSSGIGTIITEETSKLILEGQSPEQTAKIIEERGNKYIQENPDVEVR